jgi:hypothetical protein
MLIVPYLFSFLFLNFSGKFVHMIIENKRTIINVHLRKLLLIVVLTVAVVSLFYYEIIDKATLGFDQKYIIFVLIFFYLLYYFWGVICDYHYFYFSDLSPSKIVFRFYSLAPLSKRQNSLELKKEEFHHFSFERKMFGLRYYLILYQKTMKGIAKYRPISVSLLNKTQINDLTIALSYYISQHPK